VFDNDVVMKSSAISDSVFRILYNLVGLSSAIFFTKLHGLEGRAVVVLEEPEGQLSPQFINLRVEYIAKFSEVGYEVITTQNPTLVTLLRDVLDVTLYYVYRHMGAHGGCGARQGQAGGGAGHLRGHPLHEAPRSASPMQTCIVAESCGNKCVGDTLETQWEARFATGAITAASSHCGTSSRRSSRGATASSGCRLRDRRCEDPCRKELPADTDLRKGLGRARSELAGVVAVVFNPHIEELAE